MFGNDVGEISPFKKLSNNTKSIGEFIKERIFIRDDVVIIDAGKNSDLIETIRNFLIRKAHNSHFLHGIL